MGWGYSELSIAVGLGLVVYIVVAVALLLVSKKKWVALLGLSLFLVHSFLVVTLFSGRSKLNHGSFGFEVWVCGSSVEMRTGSRVSSYLDVEKPQLVGRSIIVKGQEGVVSAREALGAVGVEFERDSVVLPISDSFEFELGSRSELKDFKNAVEYFGTNNGPRLLIEDGKSNCPGQEERSWNVYVARVDEETKSFVWNEYSLNDLFANKIKLKLSERAAGGVGDCVLMEYGEKRLTPEHTCYGLLRNDYKFCDNSLRSCEEVIR